MVLRFALALAVLGATPVCAADISGFWLTSDGSATVEISRCESAWCGTVAALHGENLSTSDRVAACGFLLLDGLRTQGGGRFVGGRLTDPETGESYGAQAEVTGDILAVRVFLGTPAFGETLVWMRVQPGPAPCGQ